MIEINMGSVQYSKICIIGLGYIGLPTAAMFAGRNVKVVGIDINVDTVNTINRGQIHFIEPELDSLVYKTVSDGYLCAKTIPEAADAFIITVPTPILEDYQPDIRYIEAAVKSISGVIKKNDLIILESTSPVGTTELISRQLEVERRDLKFPHAHPDDYDVHIAYCPERVLPGHILQELVKNNRIIGGITKTCALKALELYKIFVEGECYITDSATAEMCKLTENSFRDVNIAFANELSMICEELNIDVKELIYLSNHHPRVNILQPGPGVGGHCIAVDPWFIVSKTPKLARIIHTARIVNNSKPQWVIEKFKLVLNEFLTKNPSRSASNVIVACLGITFKPNIDDLRESPALEITKNIALLHSGPIFVVEPHINVLPVCVDNIFLKNLNDAVCEADILLKLVNHRHFSEISRTGLYKERLIDVS